MGCFTRAEDAKILSAALDLPEKYDSSVQQRLQLLIDAVTDYGIFLLDPDGYVASWNSGARKLNGYERSEIIGKHFSVFYPPEAVAAGWPDEELRRARAQGKFEDEGWRIRKDGTRFWANVIITALFEPDGRLTGFAKITRDLTERRRAEEQLRESEERFRLLVDSVRDYAIFMLDPQGIVRSWNVGAEAINGYKAGEIIGKHLSVFYTAEDIAARKPEIELEVAATQGRATDEGWRKRKDGTLYWSNVAVTAIRNRDGELIGFAKVTRDMSELRRLQELELSSQRMNEFLAMLAHELRNPLAPIRNAVTIMQLETLNNPVLRNCRDVIDRQLTHVTRLVDDLLDIGRLTSGKITLRKELVPYADIVQRAVETARPVAEARRHTMTISLPPYPVHVNCDPTRISQVIQNLLVNAAKFTPEGGRIELSVVQESGFVVTSVKDTGRGLEPHEISHIFQLFAQGEQVNPNESGLGIGLTLARSLVEMHGGTLDATSAGLGQGSTFTFRLPASKAVPASDDESVEAPKEPGRRILVVDDNRDAADSTTAILRLLGYQVEAAYEGQAALAAAARLKPDVVLMDLAMPGLDGFETRRMLKSMPSMEHVYTVAMTGFGNEDDKQRTRAAGFDAHLTKPVELDGLIRLLNDAREQMHGGGASS
ncbi:PAS domain-containing sensor histidine kinase [Ramlibacter sp. GTP1]|uniref:histidine kinase n=1 Tax=Ramlibacter albus TaxID=2079448 RepID=A0A923S2P2_9BURK|nr:PAS domain S-box protein [Ramlibacter albus]